MGQKADGFLERLKVVVEQANHQLTLGEYSAFLEEAVCECQVRISALAHEGGLKGAG